MFNFYKMWTTHSFLLFLFCTALSKAHPRNAHTTAAATKNQTHNAPEAGSEATQADAARRTQENAVVMQNVQRPRFLVTYGNVYKPNQSFLSPADPFQNILLYFLMNFGREMSQSSMEENKLRRPTEFFNDPRSKIDDPGKGLNPHDTLDEEQNEEVHFFPHVGGTCMCFNNRRQEPKAKAPQKEVGGYCRKFKTETTQLKTEHHNVSSSNDTTKKSTIAVSEGANRNNTIIKVLRLGGHNQTSSLEVTTRLTTANKEEIVVAGEEIVVDLQLTPDEGHKVTKHNNLEKGNPITSGNNTNKNNTNIQLNLASKNKSKQDESYYFLSSSGGTDQRTTASNKLALYLPGANTIQAEDKQKHLRGSKKHRKRVRRHLEKIEKYLHDNLKRHPVRKQRRNEEGETKDVKDSEGKWQEMLRSLKKGNNHTDGSNKLMELKTAVKFDNNKKILMAKMGDELEQMRDINGITNLKSVEEIMKYHNWAPVEQEGKSQGPSCLSTVMPALLGVGTLLLIIGYIVKTKGWLSNLLSNKPRLVSTEANANANELKT